MMTENEIISYLKENKNKGVAFMLMPQDVKVWCINHEEEYIFSRLTSAGWDYAKRRINPRENDGVYFLSQDYKPEFKQDWVVFEINEDGFFNYNGKSYYYRDDGRFEKRKQR